MIRYIIKRLLLMIPTLLVTSLLIFWAMDLAGGDPVQQILPENATVEQQEALRESMGLNDPFLTRYFRYVGGIITGDMGTSWKSGLDVFDTFMGRLPKTLLLGGTALVSIRRFTKTRGRTPPAWSSRSSACPCRTSGWV